MTHLSGGAYKTRKFSLTFVNEHLESGFQLHLGELHLRQFRATYIVAFVVVLCKMILLGVQRGVLTADPRRDTLGEMATMAATCVTVLGVLGLTLKRHWFIHFHCHVNLVMFLLVGLVCVILPNVADAEVKSLAVVAEVLLLFAFALLLKVGFVRCVIGGWTVSLLFFVLRFATAQGSSTVSSSEIVTVAVYLVVGGASFNYLSYLQDTGDRIRFQLSKAGETEVGVALENPMIPMEASRFYSPSRDPHEEEEEMV